jgi:hypothetical protein
MENTDPKYVKLECGSNRIDAGAPRLESRGAEGYLGPRFRRTEPSENR